MEESLSLTCDIHQDVFSCPDVLINYLPKFNEYGLIVHDGGTSVIAINYCPWCGAALPESKRDEWFDSLEKLGFDNPANQEIPKEYDSDAWYKNT
jgi:hypothetical protein